MDIHTRFLLAWLSIAHLTGHDIINRKDGVIIKENITAASDKEVVTKIEKSR